MPIELTAADREQFTSSKLLSYATAIQTVADLKQQGKTIGLCHGGFDLLHPGHVKHFESARSLCDVLMVSVTSDRFVSLRKGSGRPVFDEQLRAYAIASLSIVDYVVITDVAKAVPIIHDLKPSYYIKGPDFVGKMTPGIIAEREAIAAVNGEIRYTTDPKLSTTQVIDYVKSKLDRKRILLGIDRDGTLIENRHFLGKLDNWREELSLKNDVLSLISYLQTKYDATSIVITNQSGVAQKLFDTVRVEEINKYLHDLLHAKKIAIDHWEYCPDVDVTYARAQTAKNGLVFDERYVKDSTRRKPAPTMLLDGLKHLKQQLSDFSAVIIIGDSADDAGVARTVDGLYVDATQSYATMVGLVEEYLSK